MHAASCARAATPRFASIAARRCSGRGVRAFIPTARPRRAPARLTIPRAAQQDDDFAVFRFTLGIPGFDDEDIPRVVGIVGAALLVVNHLASSNPSEAQVRSRANRADAPISASSCPSRPRRPDRPYPDPPTPLSSQSKARTETVGAILAAACIVTPSFGRRLNENAAINGGTLDVAGGEQVFAIAPGLSDAERADLAWGTYAPHSDQRAGRPFVATKKRRSVCAGQCSSPHHRRLAPGLAQINCLGADYDSGTLGRRLRPPGAGGATYMADRAAVDRARANEWEFLPQGAESVLVQTVGTGGKETRLVLLSDRPRAFSNKQRAWIAAVARKLGGRSLVKTGEKARAVDRRTWGGAMMRNSRLCVMARNY